MSKQPHVSLHSKMGGTLGPQTDKKKFLEITRAYCDAVEAGVMYMPEHITEIRICNGKYARFFVIHE